MTILDRRGSVRHPVLVVAIGALVLAGCSTGRPPAEIEDVAGDVTAPGSAEQGTSPDYVDIRTLAATIDGGTLHLVVTLAGALPAPPPADVENLSWIVALRTGSDGEAVPERKSLRTGFDGYLITLENRGVGEYHPSLVKMPSLTDAASDLPGTMVIDGATISWTMPLAALGNPGVIRAGVWAQRVDPGPTGGTTAWDFLPDDDASGSAVGWLTLAP